MMDSDATYCSEIENARNRPIGTSQSLQEVLIGESVSQPAPDGKHSYNTRNSRQAYKHTSLSQDEILLRKRQQDNEIRGLKLRLREIQAKFRIPDVSQEEKSAFLKELREMREKVEDKQTKKVIQDTVTKLRSEKSPVGPSNRPTVVPQSIKRGRGRPCKKHRRPPASKSEAMVPVVDQQEEPEGEVPTWEQSFLNETIHCCAEFLNKSINLFNQGKAQPYQSFLSDQMSRLQEIMARTKATLEQWKIDREKADKDKLVPSQIPVQRNPFFDPYLAPYTESLFSGSYPPAGDVPGTSANTANSKSTFSYFNDTNLPLTQKEPCVSLMDHNYISDKSCVNGTSVNSSDMSRGICNSVEQTDADKSCSYVCKLGEEKDSFDAAAPQSFELDTYTDKFCQSVLDELLNESFLTNNRYLADPNGSGFFNGLFNQSNLSGPEAEDNRFLISNVPSLAPVFEKPETPIEAPPPPSGRLFSPIHLQLLAKRLHLNEHFLKCCINETFKKANEQERQMEQLQPIPMDTDAESHVSNSPVIESRVKRTAGCRISNDLFNIPVFDAL